MPVMPALSPQTCDINAPDWSAIACDILCPLCEYNLRGLTQPRCPECGYRFDWPEVLNPDRQPHPFLFEHHPEKNWWSYRQTVRGACRPKRFWTSLHPSQPSRPRRMLAYWLIGACLLGLVGVLFVVPYAVYEVHTCDLRRNEARRHTRMERIVQQWGSMDAYLDLYYPTGIVELKTDIKNGDILRWYKSRFVPAVLGTLLVWPWLTLAAMMVLQISMRRARLKPIHLARCVLYSCDVSAWAALFIVACIATTLAPFLFDPAAQTFRFGRPDFVLGHALGWIGLTITWSTWRLRTACKYYLRFNWPTVIAVLMHVVVLLTVLMLLSLYDRLLLEEVYQFLGLLPRS